MMVSKEKKKEDKAAHEFDLQPFTWWCDAIHNRPYQSHWLQTNLSELDEKIKVMLSIIEEDGDSFAKRAEMYYKRRPQLIKVLEDLHKSYRSLAEKYDQLRSSDHHRSITPMINRNPTSLISPFRSLRQIQNYETQLLLPNTATSETSTNNDDRETCVNLNNYLELTDHDQVPLKNNNISKVRRDETVNTLFKIHDMENDARRNGDFEALGLRDRFMWSEKEVSALIEDHLKQQAELVRRNEEKREKIQELRSQINKLMDENGALRTHLASPKVDTNSKRNRNKTTPFLGKLTGCTG